MTIATEETIAALNGTEDFPTFAVRQDEFVKAVRGLYKTVDSKATTNPALRCMGIRTSGIGTRVELFASDGEIVQRVYCSGKVDRAGTVLLDAKTLYDLIPLLSPERIDFEPVLYNRLGGDRATIPAMQLICGAAKARLVANPLDDFPALPGSEPQILGYVDYKALREMVSHLHRFRDKKSWNSHYCQVHISMTNEALILRSTNGYSTAQATLPVIAGHVDTPLNLWVDSQMLQVATQALIADKPYTIGIASDGKGLQFVSSARDILMPCATGELLTPDITPEFSTTLDHVATVARFLKGHSKDSQLRLCDTTIALESGNGHGKAQVLFVSVPFVDALALNPRHVANVFHTLQRFKQWGETCTVGVSRWASGTRSLDLASQQGDYRLECWFGLADENEPQAEK